MKIHLFADDILLTSSDSLTCLRYISETVKAILGYMIVLDKSEALPWNAHCLTQYIADLSFKWLPDGVCSLGVTLKSYIADIAPFSLKKIINSVKYDIDR